MKKRANYWVYLIPVFWVMLTLALVGIAEIHPPDHADVLWIFLSPLRLLSSLPLLLLNIAPLSHGPTIALAVVVTLSVWTIIASCIALVSNLGKSNQNVRKPHFLILSLSIMLLISARLKFSINQKEQHDLDFMNSFCGLHFPSSATEINFSNGSIIFVAHVRIPVDNIDEFITENDLKLCDNRQNDLMVNPVLVNKLLKQHFREIPAKADCFEKPPKEFPLGKFRIEKQSGNIWMEFNLEGV